MKTLARPLTFVVAITAVLILLQRCGDSGAPPATPEASERLEFTRMIVHWDSTSNRAIWSSSRKLSPRSRRSASTARTSGRWLICPMSIRA